MPPSKGLCHAVFLLVHVASLGRNASKRDWIEAAKTRPVIAAQSFDLSGIAERLIEWGLIEATPSVIVGQPLSRLSAHADYPTLRSIAEILLRKRPPVWLRVVVQNGRLTEELIPTADRATLAWLGDDLEATLLAVHRDICEPVANDLLDRLGLAGELVVMAALEQAGFRPRQVSLISDAYGYDIEVEMAGEMHSIEVKSAVPRTASQFHISRNEFEVSGKRRDLWRIMQVIFSSAVIATGKVSQNDILALRELPSSALTLLAPQDESRFRWTDSAIVTPREDMWVSNELIVPSDYAVVL